MVRKGNITENPKKTARKNIAGKQPSIALACDWLTNVGGAERVLLSLHELYPDAPIYTSQYNKKGIDWFNDATVRTGWLQIFPSRLRRLLGPLRQHYFNHLDLTKYDIVISVTGAEAKSIRHPRHLCYCHVPTQYYWQMYDDYLQNPGFGLLNPIVRLAVKLLVRPLRRADYRAAQRPTQFITISTYAQDLIKKYYHRESVIVSPPVAVEKLVENSRITGTLRSLPLPDDFLSQGYFITTARQVTWKKLDLAIAACQELGENLLIIGTGPEHKHLERLANSSPNIIFLPQMSQQDLIPYLKRAKGYLFPSLEPFGIAPVEALALGCPVIALGKGGSLDYIQDGKNGILFREQTAASLASAIQKFNRTKFNRQRIAVSARPFSEARFQKEMEDLVNAA